MSKLVKKGGALLLKIGILALSIVFLFQKVDVHTFTPILTQDFEHLGTIVSVFICLWVLNLILDALLWTKVHQMIEPVNMLRALKINLICYSLSFVTPAMSGEWAGRYLMMNENQNRKKSFFLNFWIIIPKFFSRFLFSALAGAIVLYNMNKVNGMTGLFIGIISWATILFIYFSFKKLQNWLHLKQIGPFKLGEYLLEGRPFAKERIGFLAIAMTKFLVYNCQFALVLFLFSQESLSSEVLFLIPLYYLLSSMLPSFAAFDFILKGAVAVWIFESVVDNEPLLLLSSLTLWLINIALPAFVGLYYILKTDIYTGLKKRFSPDNQNDS